MLKQSTIDACQSWGAVVTAGYACYHGVVTGQGFVATFISTITMAFVGALVIGGALMLFCSFLKMLRDMIF